MAPQYQRKTFSQYPFHSLFLEHYFEFVCVHKLCILCMCAERTGDKTTRVQNTERENQVNVAKDQIHSLSIKFACLLHGGIRPTEKESASIFPFILKICHASPIQTTEWSPN